MTNWQSIKAASPDTDDVLLYWDGDITIGMCSDGKWYCELDVQPKGQPTHWMSLPEPPLDPTCDAQ